MSTCSCSNDGVPPAMGVAESRSMAMRLSLPTRVAYSFSWLLQMTWCQGVHSTWGRQDSPRTF